LAVPLISLISAAVVAASPLFLRRLPPLRGRTLSKPMLIFSIAFYVVTALIIDALYAAGALPLIAPIILHIALLVIYALNVYIMYLASKLHP
jgi:hypothetical protein